MRRYAGLSCSFPPAGPESLVSSSDPSWPLVTVIPNNPVCLLAGAAGMSVGIFAVLNVIG